MKMMKVGDLLDLLAAIDAAREDVDPPMTDEKWRGLDVVVRGMDEHGSDFCGALTGVGVEEDHSGECSFLAIDASNSPEVES